jgi:ribosomal protein L29
MKNKDLSKLSLEKLHEKLVESYADLNVLNFDMKSGLDNDISKKRKLKKTIARIKTLINNSK